MHRHSNLQGKWQLKTSWNSDWSDEHYINFLLLFSLAAKLIVFYLQCVGQPADEADEVCGREELLEIVVVGGGGAVVLRFQVFEVGRSQTPSLGSDVLQIAGRIFTKLHASIAMKNYLQSAGYCINEFLLQRGLVPDAPLEVVKGVVEECDGLLVKLVQVRQVTQHIHQ